MRRFARHKRHTPRDRSLNECLLIRLGIAAAPPAKPNIDRARKLLEDFASFWEVETDTNERRKLSGNLFEHVWQQDGGVVAVKPHTTFAGYFTSLQAAEEKPPKGGLKAR